MTRIFLYLVTNIAVLLVLSITMKIFGIDRIVGRAMGMNLGGMLMMAAMMGMAGSFISLAMSKWMAKNSVGAQVIEHPQTAAESWLMETVARQAKNAGIGMPEVAIFHSPDLNAFATGMNKDNALVAVSSGLLENMRREEVEAVVGHEISHVANGDMVTLALIQGVVNTFVVFFANVVGMIVDRGMSSRDREGGGGYYGPGMGYYMARMVAEIFLGILATIIVMWFSRWREFHADAGGAKLASRDKMISALERLKMAYEEPQLPEQLRAFGISGGRRSGFMRLFMSHPPLDERIAALREQRV
jgi:heat shock protein HtpX